MPSGRIVLHVVDGPFPGPSMCAVAGCRAGWAGHPHVVADLSPSRPPWWGAAAAAWHAVADDYSASTGGVCRHGLEPGSVLAAVLHDVGRGRFLSSFGPGFEDVPCVEWDYGSLRSCDISCSSSAVDGDVTVWPLLDVQSLMCVSGRSSEPTVGVFYDPERDFRPAGVPEALCGRGFRVLESGSGPGPAVRCGWTPRSPWSNASACLSCVCPLSGRYPYSLASCMACGRACVALFDGPAGGHPLFGGLVRDGWSCLVARSAGEAAEKALWLASRPSDSARMGARAVYSAMPHGRAPNLMRLMDAVRRAAA